MHLPHIVLTSSTIRWLFLQSMHIYDVAICLRICWVFQEEQHGSHLQNCETSSTVMQSRCTWIVTMIGQIKRSRGRYYVDIIRCVQLATTCSSRDTSTNNWLPVGSASRRNLISRSSTAILTINIWIFISGSCWVQIRRVPNVKSSVGGGSQVYVPTT